VTNGCDSQHTVSGYRFLFTSMCASVGLGAYHFTPHSLRHGGATCDYMSDLSGKNLEAVIFRGRWAVMKSVKTYIQSGAYLANMIKEPELQVLGGRLRAKHRALLAFFIRKL
jgi:hypothetical protein